MTEVKLEKTSVPDIYNITIIKPYEKYLGEISKDNFPESMQAKFVDITYKALNGLDKKHKDVIDAEPSIISYLEDMKGCNEFRWYIEVKIDSPFYQLDTKFFIQLSRHYKCPETISAEYEKRIAELESHYQNKIKELENAYEDLFGKYLKKIINKN